MVRRAGKRNSSSSRKNQPDASASSNTSGNGRSRIRSKTPPPGGIGRGGRGNERGEDCHQQKYDNKGGDRVHKDRGRSSERNIRTRRTTNAKENDNSNNNNDVTNTILSAPRVGVPSTWTTSSGKFQPNESGLGFDAFSHAGINGHGATSVKTTGNSSVKTSTTNLTSLPDNFIVDDNSKKKSSNKNKSNKLLNGELEDPVARHRFYKNLKKVGIKKEIIIDHDQCDDDGKTTVSEMSFSEASYIFDLAQQKESREKDRQEEALEEALELYRTWLLEGKNDDKNIFLMILDEMKKERKDEFEEIDRKHDALFNEVLDAEIKRREIEKKQQENIRGMKEDPPVISTRKGNKQKSIAKIDKILERNNSSHQTIQGQQDTDKYYDGHYPEEWDEPYEGEKIEKKDKAKSKMSSSTDYNKISRNVVPLKRTKSGILARFYGYKKTEPQSKDYLSSSKLAGVSSAAVSKKSTKSKIDVQHKHQQLQEQHEESKRMFSRLRTNLSKKKVQEKSEEDKWWKKINEAKSQEMWGNQTDEKYLKVIVPEIADDTPLPPLPPLTSISTSMSDSPIKDNISVSESKKEKKKSYKRRKGDKSGVPTTTSSANTRSLNDTEILSSTKSSKKKDQKVEDNYNLNNSAEGINRGNNKGTPVSTKSDKKKKKVLENEYNKGGVDIFSKSPNTEKKTSQIRIVSPVLVKNDEGGDGDGESNMYNDTNGKVVPPKGKTENRKSKVEKKELKDDGNNNVVKDRPIRKKKSIKGINRKDINESTRTKINEEIQNHTKKKKKAPTIISSSTQSDKNNNIENLPKGTKEKLSKFGSVRLSQENDETTDKLKSLKESTKRKKKTKINRNAKSDNNDQSIAR